MSAFFFTLCFQFSSDIFQYLRVAPGEPCGESKLKDNQMIYLLRSTNVECKFCNNVSLCVQEVSRLALQMFSQSHLFSLPGVSVSISTFSLVAIAIERYSAICNPLKSRAWQTRSHAYRVIAATWVVSLLIMVPYPVFSTLKSFPRHNGTVGRMCRLDWPNPQSEQAW